MDASTGWGRQDWGGNGYELGEVLRRKRAAKGLSAKTLSGQVGLSPSYVAKIEAGQHMPTAEVLARIFRALDFTIYEVGAIMFLLGEPTHA